MSSVLAGGSFTTVPPGKFTASQQKPALLLRGVFALGAGDGGQGREGEPSYSAPQPLTPQPSPALSKRFVRPRPSALWQLPSVSISPILVLAAFQ